MTSEAPTMGKGGSGSTKTTARNDDPILTVLFLLVLYLCSCMILYTSLVPTPWIVERSEFHREVIVPFLEEIGAFRVASRHLIEMYEDQPLVQATHVVPPAVWAAILPFLLHPTFKHNYPKITTGFTVVLTRMALVMAFANFYIVHKNLTFDRFFPNVPLFGRGFSPLLVVPLSLIRTVWFVMTLFESLRLAYSTGGGMSKQRQQQQQQRWMWRHAAAGLSVMTQYFLIYPLYILYYEVTIPRPEEVPSWIQRKAFSNSILLAIILSLGVGEIAISRLEKKEAEQQVADAAVLGTLLFSSEKKAVDSIMGTTTTTPPTSSPPSECENNEDTVMEKEEDASRTVLASPEKEQLGNGAGVGETPSSSPRKCEACGIESEFVSEGMIPSKYSDDVVYCSKECQEWHWDSTKKLVCKVAPIDHNEDKGAAAAAEPLNNDDDSIDLFDADAPEQRPKPPPGLILATNKFFL